MFSLILGIISWFTIFAIDSGSKTAYSKRGGGGGTEVVYPTAPAQPSTADAVNAWVAAMPQMYQTQMQYAPLQAQQQVALAQQYAQPLGEAYLTAQKAMYPEEYALREDLMAQAKEGMQGGVPQWMTDQYNDAIRANLGTNAGSQIGADYTATGLMRMQQDWKNYYQNMALSLSGNQPVYNATSPQYSDYMSGFTPNSVMGYISGNYGSFADASTRGSTIQKSNPWQNAGYAMQGVGSLMSGFGMM